MIELEFEPWSDSDFLSVGVYFLGMLIPSHSDTIKTLTGLSVIQPLQVALHIAPLSQLGPTANSFIRGLFYCALLQVQGKALSTVLMTASIYQRGFYQLIVFKHITHRSIGISMVLIISWVFNGVHIREPYSVEAQLSVERCGI